MSKTYTDSLNKTAITISESFIDVKTGNTITVSPKVVEQIKYHSANQTLMHLLLSALHNYLHPKSAGSSSEVILAEIAELKRLIEGGSITLNRKENQEYTVKNQTDDADLDLKEVVNVLEAFGG
ncbi:MULTISPECIES: hypothetical protein [unclassified Cytobacillus]|mgnify:CR=1 FL=1|uniref:hypothetical protein n=1 Tax=unclassified Cytobacillus TaxID=2675268 RepID=UPI00135B51EE|nr:hypothetical protein [Cytobacillus sp. AMY 15.2]KAF0817874.1 hypothetical protein KIS4809_3392 [Bacillus sp. ZZV12-4809]MCM3089962.1 hypothetical protein [Cytobacillus sp. AMY 15.2]